MFVVAMGIALVGYTLYPTAPPRMFPELGFVDTINDYSNVNHDSSLAKIFINPYAAVPSMHCAFAMMIGATGVMICRHWISKACWAAWPLLVSWVTIVTAQPLLGRRALGWLVALACAPRRACGSRAPARRPGPSEPGSHGRRRPSRSPAFVIARRDQLASATNGTFGAPQGPRTAAATAARPAAPRSSGPTRATA